MAEINFKNLISTGAHFGHVTRKWHPEYAPYILMEKNGIHIINLDETIQKLNKALAFTSEMAQKNGEFLFVGTKKQARDIIQQEADRCGMFYVVERWLGGTLTNFSTIKKSIKRLQQLEKEGSKIYEDLTKKEVQMLNRERIKLADQHRGIKDMKRLPDVIVVVDANYEITAVREARLLEIPVIGIVDTNTNPNSVDYPIPANDDSIRTIQLIIAAVADEIRAAADKESVREEVIAKEDKEQTEEQADVAEVVVDAVAVEEELNDPVVEDEPAETGSANDESTTEQSAEVPVEENNSGKEDEEETEKLEEAEVK
ncbi:MAG TPA: 30S ribosomal protein S2 [Candidatus Marinimicrobia bacterium]|jgi:small subunit ribosomal protein S2|nr:30S ribosomal protein S2 [Candidatus Neomarinimicrobiota bacterium]MDP7217130.1 30S ribosomal protein S2 [Candidatus Neomarinimicrobiota bacterium]MDP7437798.1 30S ribosomal protein S2 [Candidatus Neomarinimicrobiota bacterium]HBN46023.1 30S ribosomal protein S2 [Candidatus Neomarinimicrobiota bacterium]HJL74785.1 30S ribosomal protein S2 [Candidatus Neomarinimicrobiota bacterium]|tara:strand:+ start:17822 stop:18763 length:942 start_codon:yes stop_codon:yes gene_type:complete